MIFYKERAGFRNSCPFLYMTMSTEEKFSRKAVIFGPFLNVKSDVSYKRRMLEYRCNLNGVLQFKGGKAGE